MAVIRKFERIHSDIKPHRTTVDCGWTTVSIGEERLLHLSTYGSDQRQSDAKVSQTFQLDREAALRLAAIIEETFG